MIDSEDLPLNVSREMLQNNPQVAQIRNAVTGRVLGELESAADKDAEKLREDLGGLRPGAEGGPVRGPRAARPAAEPLPLRHAATSDEPRSLKQYVADLKPNQTEIYYLVGESVERLKANPKLEAARARGIEVLLLADPIDAFWTMMPRDYEGKPLKSLSQGDVDFGLVPLLDKARRAAGRRAEADKDVLVRRSRTRSASRSPRCAPRSA